MKTTFGRLFGTTVVILLAALLLMGTVFQFLVKDYLTTKATNDLTNDARTAVFTTQTFSRIWTWPQKCPEPTR